MNTHSMSIRRLLAVHDVVREVTIVARVVHVSSILAGEYAENEIRKDFTSSERVAIGKALEAKYGERRGQNNRQNFAELKGQRTDELAASEDGFGNRTTYEQAKKVVENSSLTVAQAAALARELQSVGHRGGRR